MKKFWKPKHKVWKLHNSDKALGRLLEKVAAMERKERDKREMEHKKWNETHESQFERGYDI